MAGKADDHNYFFNYTPSIAGVVIAATVFGAITAVHLRQFVSALRTTRIKMLVVPSMASFNEVLGYALRIPGSRSKPTGAIFPLSPLLLLFTPMMATSVMYYIFHKISMAVAPQSVLIKSTWMLKILSGSLGYNPGVKNTADVNLHRTPM